MSNENIKKKETKVKKSIKSNRSSQQISVKKMWNYGGAFDALNRLRMENSVYLQMSNTIQNNLDSSTSRLFEMSKEIERQNNLIGQTRDRIFNTSSAISLLSEQMKLEGNMLYGKSSMMSTIAEQMKLDNRVVFQGLVPSIKSLESTALASFTKINAGWEKHMIDMPNQSENLLAKAHLNFTKAAEISLIAENTFSKFTEIGANLTASTGLLSEIKNQSLQITKSYANLMKGITISGMNVFEVHPYVTELPPNNYLSEVNFIESISTSETDKYEEKENLDFELTEKLGEKIEFMLKKVDHELVNLYRGARHVIQKKGPDYKRHFSISMRELYREIMNKLANDESILQWTDSPKFFVTGQEKKPTRLARISYICRNLSNNPFNYTLEEGVNSVIWYVDLLGKGSHTKTLHLNDFQMERLMTKMETIIFTILKVGLEN